MFWTLFTKNQLMQACQLCASTTIKFNIAYSQMRCLDYRHREIVKGWSNIHAKISVTTETPLSVIMTLINIIMTLRWVTVVHLAKVLYYCVHHQTQPTSHSIQLQCSLPFSFQLLYTSSSSLNKPVCQTLSASQPTWGSTTSFTFFNMSADVGPSHVSQASPSSAS